MVASAKSPSLPDFLAAIERPRDADPQLATMSSSNVSNAPLRYEAYDAPVAPHRSMAHRTPSISSSSSLSSHFDSLGHDEPHEDSLTKTFTPGDLSLVAQEVDMRNHKDVEPSILEPAHRTNLINLDSPFYSDPVSETSPQVTEMDATEFENFWSSHSEQRFSARSWCEAAPADVEQQLRRRGFNTVAFSEQGYTKVAFTSTDSPGITVAALLVKSQGLNVSIWTLRCPEPILKAQIEEALSFSA